MVALLAAVGDSDQHTQRSLAVRLGVALGLANSLLRRCTAKGLIKIQNAPARRYAYYLTPKGFTEKSRLVAEYLSSSLDFFRTARSQYEEYFVQLQKRGVRAIAIAGIGELAEIALLSASAAGLSVAAIIAEGQNCSHFHDKPVVHNQNDAFALGAEIVIIADTINPQAVYDTLLQSLPEQKVVALPLLHVTRTAKEDAA